MTHDIPHLIALRIMLGAVAEYMWAAGRLIEVRAAAAGQFPINAHHRKHGFPFLEERVNRGSALRLKAREVRYNVFTEFI